MIATVLALLCAPAPVPGQPTGVISGFVYDQAGAAVAGARVTIRGASQCDVNTSAAGAFSFEDVAVGDYEISVDLNGFHRERRAVRLQAGKAVALTVTLRVAMVEEAIVTAAKEGSRDAQQIPMAIASVPDSDLQRLGAKTIADAAALAPSVTFAQNVGFGQLTIRGIGTNVLYAGSDPSSAMYLDGVYLARPAMELAQILDIDRIEVLRGPQGTLYGRNAVGGAINLVFRPPANSAEASADLTVGNFGDLRGAARISGPLAHDKVMGTLAIARSVRDGYVRDLEHPGHPLGGDDVATARGQLRIVLDRRTDLLLSVDADRQNGTPLAFNKVLAVKPGFVVDNPDNFRDVRSSAAPWTHMLHSGASARLSIALNPATTLISLTAFRKLNYEFFVDADSTELNLVTTHEHEQQHQVTEEITVSHQGGRATWVGGVFLFDENDHQTFHVAQPQAVIDVLLDPQVDATSRAAFGQATVGLTARLSATAGVRYTRESKDIENGGGRYRLDTHVGIPGSIYSYSDSVDSSAWTPRIGLEMKLPQDALAYLSATRGFKSGGFNLSSTVRGRGYEPEYAWSYEAGWKGALLQGRSRFDVAAFDMEYTDLQVQTPIGIGVFDIRNAASATIRGVELANTSRVGRGVEAGGHVAWLDATYDHYTAVDNGGKTRDVSGNRLNNAPLWAGRLWIEWTGDVGLARRLSIAGDVTAQSTIYYTPFNDPIQKQGPYSLPGARVEYGRSDRAWTIAAYARNLTNTDYLTGTFGTSPAVFGGRPGPPRQYAVEFSVRR
jgi:iron complex outermembrane receptor protein